MDGIFWLWSGTLVLVGVVWLSRHAALNQAQRAEKPLSSQSPADLPQQPPRVSVLVAAKDEQDNIAACVSTLLAQDYPNLEVIAVNDRSRDATLQLLEQQTAPPGVTYTVVDVSELREGWFGKNNAMHHGVAQSTGEWLCFTDADCAQVSRRTLAVAVSYALRQGVDLLSILPVLETRSFWERVIQPVCAAIMVMWFRPQKVNNPASKTAYANGAFMLMTRELYEAIGGHERIKTEVNEDIHMARRVKEIGRRLHVVQNTDLYRTRMYSSFGECWRGWSRIFYGCFAGFRRLLISAMVLLVSSILPWCSLIAGAVGWILADAPGPWATITVISALTLLAQQTLLVRFYRLNQAEAVYVSTYFMGALIALAILVNAMTKLGGLTTTTWRGTTYRGSKLSAEGDGIVG